ncbi:hypothetical protein P691DRAFT_838871 [Macrolepiota fuliginosa MF-IS2]|uniref:Uncharacterized protein n=1 Tax=Macrolepiota fuliginosa MF-IS2 TaxID=1400762 RepID=A0A9P5XI75_9AGAR|nr:hypothetical protein P691DRAFT_838871 [Macrolepiota fuliginosa MF-IS2]
MNGLNSIPLCLLNLVHVRVSGVQTQDTIIEFWLFHRMDMITSRLLVLSGFIPKNTESRRARSTENSRAVLAVLQEATEKSQNAKAASGKKVQPQTPEKVQPQYWVPYRLFVASWHGLGSAPQLSRFLWLILRRGTEGHLLLVTSIGVVLKIPVVQSLKVRQYIMCNLQYPGTFGYICTFLIDIPDLEGGEGSEGLSTNPLVPIGPLPESQRRNSLGKERWGGPESPAAQSCLPKFET